MYENVYPEDTDAEDTTENSTQDIHDYTYKTLSKQIRVKDTKSNLGQGFSKIRDEVKRESPSVWAQGAILNFAYIYSAPNSTVYLYPAGAA